MVSPLHLTLFFTRNVSLRTWYEIGTLQREAAIYRRLLDHDIQVRFITYGGRHDLALAREIPGIQVACNWLNLPQPTYERYLHYIHGLALRQTDVIKTNQTFGAELALRAARVWHKPLIARCGYMLSSFWQTQYGDEAQQTQNARQIEQEVFQNADRVVVTTEAMREDIARRIPQAREKTQIIPNYVDTDVFRPQQDAATEFDLIFIGRLEEQKNLPPLFQALRTLPDVRLCMIGKGPLRSELDREFADLSDRISWHERIPNEQLSDYINRSKLFILPSLYEGHPKTLVEAMACEAAVIGTDVDGIREIINHGENGYLCATDTDSLREAIRTLLNDANLRHNMGQKARQYVVEQFSLDRIVQMELETIRTVYEQHTPK